MDFITWPRLRQNAAGPSRPYDLCVRMRQRAPLTGFGEWSDIFLIVPYSLQDAANGNIMTTRVARCFVAGVNQSFKSTGTVVISHHLWNSFGGGADCKTFTCRCVSLMLF